MLDNNYSNLTSKKATEIEKNVNYLNKIIDIRTNNIIDENALGFMAKAFVQATLPHSNPGDDVAVWVRKNGAYTLEVRAGRILNQDTQKLENIGLPYGSIPRILFAWMATEAKRTNSKKLILGRSLTEFMHKLCLIASGGKNGSITRLKEQSYRLFRSEFALVQETKENGRREHELQVSSKRTLFWHQMEEFAGKESTVTLTDEFFKLITLKPVPIDLRIMQALQSSSLALDIYFWLTYRTFYIKNESQELRWELLRNQIGSDYKRIRDFRVKVRKIVDKIKLFWPELNVDFSAQDVIVLHRSMPMLLPKKESKA
ncbi:MAG: replication protein RepA [Cyanobacteria bacterium P01_H01_bin.74]